MKAIPDHRGRQRQVVADIEIGRTKVRQAKRRDDVPDAKKIDPRTGFDDVAAVGPANAVLLDAVAEIERGRGAAAESDDVDRLIAVRPGDRRPR
jgi:hypothetical protein